MPHAQPTPCAGPTRQTRRAWRGISLLGLVAIVACPPPRAAAAPPPAVSPDTRYPFYMPMAGLKRPANRFFVKCDASRAAHKAVYAGADAASLYGRASGGYEFVYEALDGRGQPCVYPFVPSLPQIAGPVDGTQYILRSSIPGRRVTFYDPGPWATVDLRLFDRGTARVHFEMRDIDLNFPGAVQPMGALHLEVPGGTRPGLFTAVVRRSKIFGGKNALFVPPGETMLYIEDSAITGNVGTEPDQQHTTYINGILVSHMVNSVWYGQHGWKDQASGHQLKDKAYLRIYENVKVSNLQNGAAPSAMPLIDASAFGFTWANNLHLARVTPQQGPRDGLVDLRTEIIYGAPSHYPWPLTVNAGWRMPADPLANLDKVYLSVFQNTSLRSFRIEPYVFALRPQGLGVERDGRSVVGNDESTKAQQRMVALAFHTVGDKRADFLPGAWTFSDPALPPQAAWVRDRDAFIRHALGLIGR